MKQEPLVTVIINLNNRNLNHLEKTLNALQNQSIQHRLEILLATPMTAKKSFFEKLDAIEKSYSKQNKEEQSFNLKRIECPVWKSANEKLGEGQIIQNMLPHAHGMYTHIVNAGDTMSPDMYIKMIDGAMGETVADVVTCRAVSALGDVDGHFISKTNVLSKVHVEGTKIKSIPQWVRKALARIKKPHLQLEIEKCRYQPTDPDYFGHELAFYGNKLIRTKYLQQFEFPDTIKWSNSPINHVAVIGGKTTRVDEKLYRKNLLPEIRMIVQDMLIGKSIHALDFIQNDRVMKVNFDRIAKKEELREKLDARQAWSGCLRVADISRWLMPQNKKKLLVGATLQYLMAEHDLNSDSFKLYQSTEPKAFKKVSQLLKEYQSSTIPIRNEQELYALFESMLTPKSPTQVAFEAQFASIMEERTMSQKGRR